MKDFRLVKGKLVIFVAAARLAHQAHVRRRDFPVHVGEVCRAALDLPGDEFLAWARRRFPAATPAALPAGESASR